MLERIIRFLNSKKAAIILMAVYAFLMALATMIEKMEGTTTAKALIYYSPLFILLHLVMVLNFLCLTLKGHLYHLHKLPYMMVHGALLIILLGASYTHFLSQEGMMSLREGEKSNLMMMKHGATYKEAILPFEVELLDFSLQRYPGSQSPSSYESLLRVHVDGTSWEERVYMNHVLDLKGFRFFQASYDPDELGSILSVSYDVTGRRITYTGYVLLFIGLLACLMSPHSRFRRLSRQLKIILTGGLLMGSVSAQAFDMKIDPSHAREFGKLPMQSIEGRIIPVNTFSQQLARKLQIEETLGKIDSDQWLLDLITEPTRWANTPLILVEDQELSEVYTQNREVISYRDAFDPTGHYRYGEQVESVYQKNPSQRSHLERELLKLDEKVNLLHQIFNYQLVKIFPKSDDVLHHKWMAAGDQLEEMTPQDSLATLTLFKAYRNALIEGVNTQKWTSASKALAEISEYQRSHLAGLEICSERIEAEVRYNRYDLLSHVKRGYLIMGGILLLLTVAGWFVQQTKRWYDIVKGVLISGILLLFLLHGYHMGLRWYISGHAPWSNAYETMVFLGWVAVLGGGVFARKSFITFALSVIFGGVVLFVSSLNWMDPQITPLVPVLKSRWLMFHVASMMVAYGFLGIGCMISTLNLIATALMGKNRQEAVKMRIERLSIICELALMIGLTLMCVGIFLGAVWANESWGRYWSWDPKETWALITTIIYAIVLHIRWFEKKKNNLRFNVMTQLAFLSVLMTYFGVNYLLSGMHAYGNTNGLAGLPIWVYAGIIVFFILPSFMACLRTARLKE